MKSKKDKPGQTKADILIEEALQSVEKAEARKRTDSFENDSNAIELEEVFDTPTQPRGGEPLAKIDLKQFVEKETYLRLAADFENFRRRAVKERSDAERSGREKILRGFLEILDNLERGLAQAKSDQSPLADGIRIILSQADAWLRSEGLERVDSVGRNFDPMVHEAISQVPSDLPSGIVVEEIKRGYSWAGRLLRPATVVVSRGSDEITERQS